MKLILKRSLIATSVAAAMSFAGAAHATNGYNLIGIGSYQMGMAGAVVADPGSAMTAITNPAGLAAIQPKADFSLEAFMPKRSVNFRATGGKKINSDTNMYGVPALGWSAPTSQGSDIYFGGGMYGTSGMGVDYPSSERSGYIPNTTIPMYFNGYSNIQIFQMAPAVAWKVNHHLSLGVALDIGYMSASFQQGLEAPALTPSTLEKINMTRSNSAFGMGATLGVLYKINPMWTVGAAYSSTQTYHLKYNLSQGDITTLSYGAYPAGRYQLTMKTPQKMAIGFTVHPMKTLAVSAQVKWIDWQAVMNKLSVTGPKDYNGFTPKWKNQTVVAVAANYHVNKRLQVRAGYNYAKSPIDNNAVGYNLILPAVVESHYTVGLTYDLNHHWSVGGAYMVAPKKTFTAPMTSSFSNPNKGQKISLSEQAVSFNIGYKF